MANANGTCSLEYCEKDARHSGGLCAMHNTRLQKHGKLEPDPAKCARCDITFTLKTMRPNMFCSMRCRNAKYRAENKDELSAANRAWLEGKREDINARRRAERAADPQRFRDVENASRAQRREATNARAAVYRAANRERINASIREWGRLNLDRKLEMNRRRRAQQRGASAHQVTSRDVKKMFARFDGCAYCGERAEHIEHVLPIARGGSHSIGNIVPSCARCNLTKGAKTVMEWRVWKMRQPTLGSSDVTP